MEVAIIENSGIVDKPSGDGDTPSIFAGLFSLPPAQFTILSVLIGIMISEHLNPDEQNSLGNFIANIGQTLSTVAGQTQFLQDVASEAVTDNTVDKDGSTEDNGGININAQLNEMKQRIAQLESKLNENK